MRTFRSRQLLLLFQVRRRGGAEVGTGWSQSPHQWSSMASPIFTIRHLISKWSSPSRHYLSSHNFDAGLAEWRERRGGKAALKRNQGGGSTQEVEVEAGTGGRGKRRANEGDCNQVPRKANVKLQLWILYFKHGKLRFSVSPNKRLLNSTMFSKSKSELQ